MANFTPQEIEEFLQEFFDVVGARQYIGARYVPIFGRAGEDTVEWDDGAPYEPLTVVMHQGVSYVSRQYVPTGTQITDTDFWVETYRFNAQVEQYRQEVLSFQSQIDGISQTLEDDYVPFPDPVHYPKYGTEGQVLTTLADGTTMWEDPVVPSDEQAETVITGWLADHPEATTTVQDGSITDAKINTNATILRTRGNNTVTDCDITTDSGFYALTNVQSSGTVLHTPSGRDGCMLVYRATSNVITQVYDEFNPGSTAKRYFRQRYGNNWSPWYELANTGQVTNAVATVNTRVTNTRAESMLFRGTNTYADLNDARDPGYYAITNATSSGTANVPLDRDGSLLVWCPLDNVCAQLYVAYQSGNTRAFIRQLYGTTWTPWIELSSTDYADAQIGARAIVNRGNNAVTDCDTTTDSGFYALTNVQSSGTVLNTPSGRDGCMLVYSPTSNVTIQTYDEYGPSHTAKRFFRQNFGGTWSPWYELTNASQVSDMVSRRQNILSAFTNIVCCGDSLTRGVINVTDTTYAYARNPYPAILGQITGATMTVIAQGGYDASEWWDAYANQIVQKTNCLAIIYLGTNGGLTDSVDTDCPSDAEMSTWTDNNTGNYGRIIQSWKDVGAKVLLINVYPSIGDTTRAAVVHLAERFGCALVDNQKYPEIYRTKLGESGYSGVHYNALGYSKFAYDLCDKVAMLSDEMLSRIIPTDMIPA